MEKAITKALLAALFFAFVTANAQTGQDITGQLLYHFNAPMSNATVSLYDATGNLAGVTTTNGQGMYSFSNVPDGTYSIVFSTSQSAGGVNLQDAFLVMMRLLNLITFNPIQTLAADVNNNGYVDWNDYTIILVGYLNQGNPFNNPWAFQNLTVTVPSRSGLLSSSSSSGDVNGSYQPTKSGDQWMGSEFFTEYQLVKGAAREIGIYTSRLTGMAGMHLVLEIPSGLTLNRVGSELDNLNYTISNNMLRITWLDLDGGGISFSPEAPLFNLEVSATETATEGAACAFRLLPESHLISRSGEIISGASLVLPSVSITQGVTTSATAYPNPFREQVNIAYQLESEAQVVIRLFDQAGRLAGEIENTHQVAAGSYQAIFDGNSLAPGMYHYTFSVNGANPGLHTGTIIKSK